MKTIIVIGAGLAGIEAAANLTRQGHKVILLDKKNEIGGHVRQWDRLFPTQASASEIVDEIIRHLNNRAEILLNTTLQYCERKNTGGFEVIFSDNRKVEADAILVSTGFDTFDAHRKEEYGYGIYDHVITSVELEEMFRQHKVLCKNGRPPQRVAFIHCVGSRDEKVNNRHCSKVCCVTAVKQACEMRELYPNCEVFNLYMDLRMFDRHFETLYHEAQSKYHVNFIRGRLSEAGENKEGQLVLKAEDTLAGKPLKLTVDMLVLMVGMEACESLPRLSKKLNIITDTDGFLSTLDGYTHNNQGQIEGIFFAGCCTGPKTIPETLADARSAAGIIHNYLLQ